MRTSATRNCCPQSTRDPNGCVCGWYIGPPARIRLVLRTIVVPWKSLASKPALVLVVVFLSDWPWLSWTIIVVSYSSYFVVKSGSFEASDPGDEDMMSEGLAHLSESAQLVGEFMLVLLSAYFISVFVKTS